MIFAGPCLYVDDKYDDIILQTAMDCADIGVTHFRCKLVGGGTTPEKYCKGIGHGGVKLLENIDALILPTGTEIHTPIQLIYTHKLSYVWIGARNCQNYSLIESISIDDKKKMVLIKRSPGMTISELIGIYDICKKVHRIDNVYIVERGINTFDRLDYSRWSPDLKGVIRLKNIRPDIFRNLVVDCSHSVGVSEWIQDIYKAFKAIGVKHFMFECTSSGESKTDQGHMLSVKQLGEILK